MDSLSTLPLTVGSGRIKLDVHGQSVHFSELSSTYPLKLLSSRSPGDVNHVALLYLLTYGGGLVGGDAIRVSAEIGSNARLVMLSQGSTKVFKFRLGERLATVNANQPSKIMTTSQCLDVTIAPGGALFLLPDPVTCFRAASYDQVQTFRLSEGASLVMLDWITSGRKSLGEDWEFSRYYSSNQFWIGGSRIAKDDTLLEDSNNLQISRTLRDRLAPYSCYATLVLIGPLVCNIVDELQNEYQSLSVFAQSSPQKLLWSMSPLIDNGKRSDAWIIRIAAIDSEAAKHWLKDALHGLRGIVGQDVYLRTFA